MAVYGKYYDRGRLTRLNENTQLEVRADPGVNLISTRTLAVIYSGFRLRSSIVDLVGMFFHEEVFGRFCRRLREGYARL